IRTKSITSYTLYHSLNYEVPYAEGNSNFDHPISHHLRMPTTRKETNDQRETHRKGKRERDRYERSYYDGGGVSKSGIFKSVSYYDGGGVSKSGISKSEACKSQLRLLLKENMEIFAWEPIDMTGVPR
ncbi:hypothetical protein Tco_0220204, partial [Tanacetum coccineum]